MKRHVLLNLWRLACCRCYSQFARLRTRRARHPRTLFRRLCSRRQGQPLTPFRAQWMRFVLLWADPNNGNNPPPLDRSGHREINWDGGNPNIVTTTDPVTPFNTFLNTRGGQFTTPGVGPSQATPSGLAGLFNNPTYGTTFSTFSPSRLFTPVGSNITEALFFVPGTNGAIPATVTGFGAVFTDVDQPDGSGPRKKKGNRGA